MLKENVHQLLTSSMLYRVLSVTNYVMLCTIQAVGFFSITLVGS